MNIRLLGHIITALLVVVLIGVAVHTPLTVWLGTIYPHFDEVIKAWKELLMGLCLLLLAVYITAHKKWSELWRDWIIRLSAAYALVHMLLLLWLPQGVAAASSGILIDTRFVLFFVLVYVTVRLIPTTRRLFIVGAATGAVIVIGFAALQIMILPDDILANIGYSKQTISPYLTVDLNHDYVRINSTLRGPNPVGAYAGMCLANVLAFVVQRRKQLSKTEGIVVALLSIGSLTALWASYSRSAVVAGIGMVTIVATAASVKKISRNWWIACAVVLFGIVGGIIAARDTAFVSNVILHENPAGGSAEKSNDGHVDSLHDGVNRMMRQPLGGGIGSTGSASLRGESPLIIENQYLFIAHEIGWVGLLLFLTLFGLILTRLWQARQDWLALGVFASGVGLAFIGLLLPVWVDDTTAIVWWGLAGVALAKTGRQHGKSSKSN